MTIRPGPKAQVYTSSMKGGRDRKGGLSRKFRSSLQRRRTSVWTNG